MLKWHTTRKQLYLCIPWTKVHNSWTDRQLWVCTIFHYAISKRGFHTQLSCGLVFQKTIPWPVMTTQRLFQTSPFWSSCQLNGYDTMLLEISCNLYPKVTTHWCCDDINQGLYSPASNRKPMEWVWMGIAMGMDIHTHTHTYRYSHSQPTVQGHTHADAYT